MTVETVLLDDIDHALLGLLRKMGRMLYRDLGIEVSLGASATADRVKRLERIGVIAGYSAVIDPETIGRTLRAAVDVRLPADGDHEGFEAEMSQLDEVDLAAHVTGPFDYLILMSVAGVPRLDDIVRSWGRSFLAETSTRILLHTVELANQPG